MAAVGFAQDVRPAATPSAASSPIDVTAITKLITGDQINLRIVGEADISGSYRVREDGNVFLPIVREVHIAGLSIPEATQRLQEALTKYIMDPQLSLELGALAPRKVYLSGEIGGKGVVEWTPDLTLLKLLNSAGGIAPTGDMTIVKLKRGEDVRTVDVTSLMLRGQFEDDIPIEPNDVVLVPRRSRCFIMGPVPGAGEAYFEPGETLYQLLSRVGIIAAKSELRTVRLIRRDATLVVNMDLIRKTGDIATDVKLTHLDKIVVPDGGEIYLAGAVGTPGVRPLRGAETAVRAILGGGGYRPEGVLDRAILVHEGESRVIDLSRALREGDTTTDVNLTDGDLLIVPENKTLVFGAVTKPGPVALQWPSKLSEALAAAGGPQPNSDLRNVTVLRDGVPQKIDVRGFYQGGAIPEDLRLQPMDIVLIPEAWVSVSGQVKSAGRIPYRNAETMQDLLSTVGNPDQTADLTAVYLIRGNETRQLDITTLVRNGDQAVNVALEPGDKVIFPEGLGRQIYITGQITNSSGSSAKALRYEEAPDIARAIASVSGVLTGGGDITQTRILRKGQVIPVDLHALYYENDMTQNVALEPGDTIWIPANEHGFVYVFGMAGTKQIVHFPGMHLTQAIAQLSVPTAGADTNHIKLLRDIDGKREVLDIPWGSLWKSSQGGETKDPVLERGDIIFIAEKDSDRHWRQFRSLTDWYFLTRSLVPAQYLPF